MGGDACFRSMRNGGRWWAEQGLLEFWNGREELVPRPLAVLPRVRSQPGQNRCSCWRSRFSGRRTLHVDLPPMVAVPHKYFSAGEGGFRGATLLRWSVSDCLQMLPSIAVLRKVVLWAGGRSISHTWPLYMAAAYRRLSSRSAAFLHSTRGQLGQRAAAQLLCVCGLRAAVMLARQCGTAWPCGGRAKVVG